MSRLFTALLLLGIPLATSALAQDTLFRSTGDTDFGNFGLALAGAGDVDGDGVGDLIVGAPDEDPTAIDSGLARILSGSTGLPLLQLDGDGLSTGYGWSVDGAGDVNGDGFDDVLVGAWRESGEAGLARLHSGADGSTLSTFTTGVAKSEMGYDVAGIGDFDLDGFPDLALSAPGAGPTASHPGLVRIVSGQDGSLIAQLDGELGADGFGFSIDGAGDTNGDGFADLVVGAVGFDGGGLGTGKVYVYGGPAAGPLHSFVGGAAFAALGFSVAGAGDVDGDGLGDILAGAPFSSLGGPDHGLVRVWSGLDGSWIRDHTGAGPSDWMGWSLAGLGDIDGDGRAEYAAGAPFASVALSQEGSVEVFSGSSGAPLFQLAGSATAQEYGMSVDGLGDVNADGRPDFAVGSSLEDVGGLLLGSATIYSGGPTTLQASVTALSVSSGGFSSLLIDPGVEHATKLYIILGSLSGNTPGFALGSDTVPLNFDDYTNLTIASPNGLLIAGGLGLLDGNGQAAPFLQVQPATNPNFAGLTLHHAAVVLGSASVDHVTVSVPLTLLP